MSSSLNTRAGLHDRKSKIHLWASYSFLTWIIALPIIFSLCVHLQQSKKVKVAFVTNNTAQFWAIAKKGTEAAAKKYNVDVEFYMPAYSSAAEQHRIIEDLVAKGVQGIAISPADAAHQSRVLNKIIPDNVYFITQDSDLQNRSKRLCYIGTNNTTAGWAVGELVKEVLPQGGQVMIFVGKLDVLCSRERRQGVIASLAALPESNCRSKEAEEIAARPYPIKLGKYELLGTMTDQSDRERCYANAIDTIVKYPHIKAFVGLWDYNVPAMMLASQRYPQKQIKLVGFDEHELTLQAIKDGRIYATVVQNPYMFGYEVVHILQSLIRQGKLPDDMPPEVKMCKEADGYKFFVDRRVIKKQNDGKLFDMNVVSFTEDLDKKKGKR